MSTLVWNTSFIAALIPVLIQSHLSYQIIWAFQSAHEDTAQTMPGEKKALEMWIVCVSSKWVQISARQNTTQVSRPVRIIKYIGG